MKTPTRNSLRLILPVLWLVASLLLGACGNFGGGNDSTQISLVTSDPSVTAAVELPPTVVTTGNGKPTLGRTATTSPSTATPVVAPTPTTSNNPISEAPTVPPGNAFVVPTPTAEPTARPTPTPEGPSVTIDRAAELKTIKAAYDAINKHLFKEPDNPALLNAALKEVSSVSGASIPSVTFSTDSEADWNLFSQDFNKMLDSVRDFKYPKNQLAHRVVTVMADAVDDEHTYFLPQSDYQSRQNLLSGDNSSIGFGVLVTTLDNKAYIVRLVSGGPAQQAGVHEGDQIIQYDNTPINGDNWTIVRNAGENETHKFVLSRPGAAQPITLSITKKKYNLPTVEYRMINGHIGYIAVRDFFLNVADETDKAMVDLRKQGADSWIVDLRENPGGINVEQLTGRFVQGGQIMGYNTDRKNRESMKVSNDLTGGPDKGKPFAPLLPTTVLVDDGSASSSEMFALAARDFKLGPLIGTKTAGALGHTAAYPLGDGTAISVTVDVYESRGGERVNGIGVTPDVTVDRTVQDLITGTDPQLSAGVDYLEKELAKK